MKYSLLLIASISFLSLSVSRAEMVISGPVEELQNHFETQVSEKQKFLSLTGEYAQKIEASGYWIEVSVYSRGKSLKDLIKANRAKVESLQNVATELGEIEVLPSNTFALPQNDLATSEVREIEYQDTIRIECPNFATTEALLYSLSTIDGLIVREIRAKSNLSPETRRAAMQKAIDDLSAKKQFYESALNVTLIPTGDFQPTVLRTERKVSEDVFELSPFEVSSFSSKRKWSDRETKVFIEKSFYEDYAQFTITGGYVVKVKE